jgi:SNF2 family DNA or RNA helicase
MYYGDITALFYDARALFDYDILITTGSFYSLVTSTVRDIGAWFNRVILDECDSIAFFTSKEIPSQAVWLVSATADLTKEGAYTEHAKKNVVMCKPSFIQKSINLPGPVVKPHVCYNEYVALLQQGIVQNVGALHALDFSVFKFPYLRFEQQIDSAKALLSATFRNKSLELAATKDSMAKLEEAAKVQSYTVDEFIKKKALRSLLTKDLADIIRLLDGRKCALCAERFVVGTPRAETDCCNTSFCQPCVFQWVDQNGKCPVCCKELKPGNIKEDVTSLKADGAKSLGSDKMENLAAILESETARNDYRILIFSDYSGTLLKVRAVLNEKKLPYAEIEGNQITMTRAMTDFKSGKKPVLIIDSQQYGAGMNMEMTTAVIMMHKTEREAQIVGRAQRLGRVNRLHVHQLIYEGEK